MPEVIKTGASNQESNGREALTEANLRSKYFYFQGKKGLTIPEKSVLYFRACVIGIQGL